MVPQMLQSFMLIPYTTGTILGFVLRAGFATIQTVIYYSMKRRWIEQHIEVYRND